jgi:hypothetical protein
VKRTKTTKKEEEENTNGKKEEEEEEGLMPAEVSSPLADVTRSKAIYIPVGKEKGIEKET